MAKKQTLDLNKLIPSSLKNETLESLVSNLFNSFLSEEQSISLNGSIGKTNPDDLTITAENLDRKVNALIPCIHFKAGTEENIFTFNDLVNKMSVLGVNTDNLRHLLKEQSFNFSPPIDYDKFVNYQLYYWVGPDADSSLDESLFENWNPEVNPEYYVIQRSNGVSQNSWQLSNRWVHIDDFSKPQNSGYAFSKCIQASRPIIEYSRNIEIDSIYSANGRKTKFNQIPQFKLYHYDGTFSGITSGIFYYDEDINSDIDPHIKKRIRIDDSGKFIFAMGIHDDQGRLLYFKDTQSTVSATDDTIKSIWRAGVANPAASSVVFSAATPGEPAKATFTINSISSIADSQKWEVIAFEPNKLNVIGTRSGHVGIATVGQKFICDDIQFTISLNNESVPFVVGEKFDFKIHSPANTRYVKDDGEGNTINYPGWAAADLYSEGTWVTPIRMFQNLTRENRSTFSYTDLVPHMTSVMAAQNLFEGFAIGSNNSRQLLSNNTFNYGLGGKIRDFSSNLPLLISSLIQNDISPLAIIEFAETQYATALSSIDEFLLSEFASYFAEHVWDINDDEDLIPSRKCIQQLMQFFEDRRDNNENARAVFSDSTCLVKNWPITLPMMGVLKRVPPKVPSQTGALDYDTFDFELGLDIIRHHDGHISYAVKKDTDVDVALTTASVLRSDGIRTPGHIGNAAPTAPYARQLWFNSSTKELNYFDVDFDTEQTPPPLVGGIWYVRSLNEIRKWNTFESLWETDSDTTVSSRWRIFDFATVRNCLVGAVEQKLFDSVNPFFDDENNLIFNIKRAASSTHAEGELARFSSKYNYDTFAPDYNQANAFTWNYKLAPNLIPPIPTSAAFFTISDGFSANNLVIKITDAAKIQSARNQISGNEPKRGITGIIVTQPVYYNPNYNFHYIPESIDFFELSMEVCDSTFEYTEDHINEVGGAFLPGNRLCPWGSQLVAEIPAPSVPTPARWFDIYKAYFNRPTSVISTCRPNLEPWKLMGQATKPVDWDSLYKAPYSLLDIDPALLKSLLPVKAVSISNIALNGLLTIDGVALMLGDRVLVTGQAISSENGIYQVSSSNWVKQTNGLTNDTIINVTNGYQLENTIWIYRNLAFNQVRLWTDQMWSAIKASNPGLKLCVNTKNDELLPPYVSPTKFSSAEALYTSIPNGISNSYEFGDNGPIEIVWKKSVEYFYSLARNSFREFPLEFIDKSWGYSYVSCSSENHKVERNLLAPISVSKFLLHGEKLHIINNLNAQDVQSRITSNITFSEDAVVTFEVALCIDNKTIFSMHVNNQKLPFFIEEGVTTTVSMPPTRGVSLSSIKIEDFGIPFELGDKLIVKFTDGAISYSHSPAVGKRFIGLGQLFTNLLRFNFISKDFSEPATAYRGWSTRLSHRTASMVRPDSVIISSKSELIPSTAYDLIIKKSPKTTDNWISALRIQLVDMGPEFNPANPSQKFIKNENGVLIPASDASTWVFRIEGYTPQYPFLEYYELDTSNNSEFQTFTVLNGISTSLLWKRYLTPTVKQKITLPHIVTGLQNVLNIVYGYIDKLVDDGWSYSANDSVLIDEQTGRNLDWQLEVEKFIDTVYTGMSAGEAYILNPFMGKAIFNTPVGLMSVFSDSKFIDIYSTQAAYDVIGNRIPLNNLLVTRTDEKTIITSSRPMFAMHVFKDEFEHTVLFKNSYTHEKGTSKIFDSFTGYHLETATLNYVRSEYLDKKPSFGGFFINGNNVSRNIVSSIDNIANYYNPSQTFSEKTTSEHALALLGFSKKQYFTNLQITDNAQFNFWRGMIQAKGTNMAVGALLNYKGFGEASVDEFWAYKLSEFGDAREKSYPEIKINTRDVLQRLTKIQFYDVTDPLYSPIDSYIQIENNDDSRWFSLDDLGKGLSFEAQPIEETVEVSNEGTFPKHVRLQHIYHNGYGIVPVVTGAQGATVINSRTIRVLRAGTYKVKGYTWLNPSKFSPIKLFDYKENTMVKEIGLWHPAIGIHAYQPLEIINIINSTNPALHSYSIKTNNDPNSRILKPWGKNEVGVVWWNTENLDYAPYYDANIFLSSQTREGTWGNLSDWASIDLYQWTESDVHPSQYDELAAEQEGNAEIDNESKAAGRVAIKNTYYRNRLIKVRPIAWSQLGTATGDGHPAFGPARFTKLLISGNVLFADKGRLEDIGITAGRSLGAWKNSKPFGEVTIGSAVQYNIGSSSQLSSPDLNPSGVISDINVSLINDNLLGVQVGPIYLKSIVDRTTEQVLGPEGNLETNVVEKHYMRLRDDTGMFEDVEIENWFSNDYESNKNKIFQFDKFGLKVEIVRSINAPQQILSSQIANGISLLEHDIYIREGVNYTEVVALPGGEVYINDDTDPDFVNTEYGWRVWDIPTQLDLDEDLQVSPRKWKPYYGDEVVITPTPEIIKQIKSGDGVLTLKDGTSASRYLTSWGDWIESKKKVQKLISDTISGVVFSVDDAQLDASRASVYINGTTLAPSEYTISENKLTVNAVVRTGHELTFVYDKYTPTEEELDFDPDVQDDVSILIQYKQDYEYTRSEVRDENGNIIGSKYYFWVRDKTVPQGKKSMSLVQASQLLANGDSQYAILSRAIIRNEKVFFDSCAVYGLNTLVTKNDSFKLRFIRNFVLRDDPEEIKLKNIHTEWELMRRGQNTKIPKKLWDLITDAACGQDIAGNSIPSMIRIDYDNRNGTRTKYGFKPGQIFADTNLVRESILNTILNTSITINLGKTKLVNYIRSDDLDFNNSDAWFETAAASRETMDAIWRDASPKQINEIFFNALETALADNYEFSDIIKTSMFALNITRFDSATSSNFGDENEIF